MAEPDLLRDDHYVAGEHAPEDAVREPTGGDTVESASRTGWLPNFSSTSRRGRRAVGGFLALILGCVGMLLVLHQAREWLDERGLRDQVALRASIAVWASSSSPAGGRVDYSVSIHNVGERPIRITEVDIANARLRIRNRDTRRQALGAGQTLSVPLSVRLDCAAEHGRGRQEPLQGVIAAYPLSGRLHSVHPTFEHATLITDVADTLCRIRADLRGAELSGPVIRRIGGV